MGRRDVWPDGGKHELPPYERLTTDANKLTEAELAEISKRLQDGSASSMDRIYASILREAKKMYEINPKHERFSSDNNLNGTILPNNHAELWDKRSWYNRVLDIYWSAEGQGKKRVYYRFSPDGLGNYHWSGYTGPSYNKQGKKIDPIDIKLVPIEMRRGKNNL